MAKRTTTDPSRHTRPKPGKKARTRRIGPTSTQLAEQPRDGGHRTARPKRPREGQPPGHVGAR
jgi:hypothetical protein